MGASCLILGSFLYTLVIMSWSESTYLDLGLTMGFSRVVSCLWGGKGALRSITG